MKTNLVLPFVVTPPPLPALLISKPVEGESKSNLRLVVSQVLKAGIVLAGSVGLFWAACALSGLFSSSRSEMVQKAELPMQSTVFASLQAQLGIVSPLATPLPSLLSSERSRRGVVGNAWA